MIAEPSVTLSPVERLLALEEIKQVFAGRLRCMDDADWDRYASFHTADMVSDTFGGPAGAQVVGADAVAAAIRETLDGDVRIQSVHHGHSPEITLTSDTTARGVWAMEDHLWWQGDYGEEHLHGYGHYHEEYRKVDGRWLISYRNLTRLRVDATPGFAQRKNVHTTVED